MCTFRFNDLKRTSGARPPLSGRQVNEGESSTETNLVVLPQLSKVNSGIFQFIDLNSLFANMGISNAGRPFWSYGL